MEHLFSAANTSAMLAWLALIFIPRTRFTHLVIRSGALPVLYSVIYVILFLTGGEFSLNDFNTMGGVRHIFDNPNFLIAGWIHYLAFDLFVGIWMMNDAEKRGIKHLFLTPILFLTFLFGPAGFLAYVLFRKYLPK